MRVSDNHMWVISTVDLGGGGLVEKAKVREFITTAAYNGIRRIQWVGWGPKVIRKGDGKLILKGMDEQEWNWLQPFFDDERVTRLDHESFSNFMGMVLLIFREQIKPRQPVNLSPDMTEEGSWLVSATDNGSYDVLGTEESTYTLPEGASS